ncbi:hypothetical protein PAHAL_1G308900 [Panicum hallii]|uniref:Uncharacterized protein n=1 Tax=Panicum hallii TaxID=206008 RepID=A0A2T8KWZ8_9POAL|nr:hypothetical protein PAHAL_1G308900 [Panicum hallii]
MDVDVDAMDSTNSSSTRDTGTNQLPPTTSIDTPVVQSSDDGGRTRTAGTVACRRPPQHPGTGVAVKKGRLGLAGAVAKTMSTPMPASPLTPSTPDATSSGVHLFNSLGFDSEAFQIWINRYRCVSFMVV